MNTQMTMSKAFQTECLTIVITFPVEWTVNIRIGEIAGISFWKVVAFGGMITAIIADDIESLLESFAPLAISLMCFVKYINFLYNFNQMKRLMDIMQEDWKFHAKLRNEYEILCEHYAIARKITTNFVAFLLGLVTPFGAMPLLLNIGDALGLCNISDDKPLAFRVEVKLENFVETDAMDIELRPNKFKKDKWYQNARDCVLLHKRNNKYTRHAQSSSIRFNHDLPFVRSSVSQLDGATVIEFDRTTNGRWYQSSINCRKLLTIMLSKSIAPLTLTACKLYTLNLESFTTNDPNSRIVNPTRGGENSENKTGVLAGLTNPGGGVHRHIRVDKLRSFTSFVRNRSENRSQKCSWKNFRFRRGRNHPVVLSNDTLRRLNNMLRNMAKDFKIWRMK
ncbi:putative odorant receptor [Apis cerana cerana]|uniref:Odorant receptor n=1 Tax=Apis cerana cerana TaxID=94128 RepID=A0A2A3EA25_APICC|nr:putative odorant receptor [Apis cerana cerana]